MDVTIKQIENLKCDDIKLVYLECTLMPNGEVIHMGDCLMWITDNEDDRLQYLYERSDNG